jgi:CBS domain containing-hemolysin-like protein
MKKKGFLELLLGEKVKDEKAWYETLDSETKDMMKGIVELSDTTVKEVMVPRIDVVFVPIDIGRKELFSVVSECEYSRLPVYDTTIDNIIGILHVKDLLRFLVKGIDTIDLRQIIRKVYFVPESKKLNAILKELKHRKVHIAIVVDEYGGTEGIVCLEDVIEEIVGEIQDEFDNETEEVIKVNDDVFLCDARINIEDFNVKLGLELPEKDYDTLGGFVLDLFGKIPVRYEKARYGNTEFVIHEMDANKILTIKVVIHNSKKDEYKDREES